jgi:hypothetical protein
MKDFIITGEFRAMDIDDAFRLLAMHFDCLLNDSDLDVFEGEPHHFEVINKTGE